MTALDAALATLVGWREPLYTVHTRIHDNACMHACIHVRIQVSRREALYMCTKRISSTTIKAELKPHTDGRRQLRYRIDPMSRYTHLPSGFDWDGSEKRKAAEAVEREAVRLALMAEIRTCLYAHAYMHTHMHTFMQGRLALEAEMAEQRRVVEAEHEERYHRLWAEWATSLGEYEVREREARVTCEQAVEEAAALRARAEEAARKAEAGWLACRAQSEELERRVEELQVRGKGLWVRVRGER